MYAFRVEGGGSAQAPHMFANLHICHCRQVDKSAAENGRKKS